MCCCTGTYSDYKLFTRAANALVSLRGGAELSELMQLAGPGPVNVFPYTSIIAFKLAVVLTTLQSQ